MILREQLDRWISDRQAELELDEDAPPPLTRPLHKYNRLELIDTLQHTAEGVFVKGEIIGVLSDVSRTNQVYGIKVNNKLYAIFFRITDLNDVTILEI